MISKINIKLLITLSCFLFIGTSIYINFESLSNEEIATEEILWLLLGMIFSYLSIIINAYAWKYLINNIGCHSNKFNIVKLFLSTNIYKYFPGGIWHFVSRYNTLRLEFSTEKSIESILLEPLLMLVAGLIFIPFGSLNIFVFILCWSSTLVFLPVFRNFIIQKLKTMKASIFTNNDELKERNSAQNNKNISRRMFYPYKPLLVEIIFVLFRFMGFLFCMNAFAIGSLISQGELISSFSLAWIIGLIVPAAPGGLGVFESVILFSLGSNLPEAPLLASLLCYRLVSTISDIFGALTYPVKKLFKV
ncbi:lysylphosphatidylglycerol synthase transmembrane domain-containing protein [Prochlorococcus marinus]|uniref:lysylphosphatidylglycerol synthase transmembrane domain-containing protein n=1 Tax=Prochlorococcus marinus TaxID=1219 RepID=UPI0022B2B263|nr:lysylphosphatidylglycerol synthase domain-containing protein [Prochlorococcus marinus]